MLTLIHTADWHLGHHLRDFTRDAEHRDFLSWLVDTVDRRSVDALLIAGDIFDTSNPSAEAQALWYGFLAEAKRSSRDLQIVAIAGNHDSAGRLNAPREILSQFGVHVIGGLVQSDGGAATSDISARHHLVTLVDRNGKPAASVLAVPYLRPADLARSTGYQPEPVANPGDDPAEVLEPGWVNGPPVVRDTGNPAEALEAKREDSPPVEQDHLVGDIPPELVEAKREDSPSVEQDADIGAQALEPKIRQVYRALRQQIVPALADSQAVIAMGHLCLGGTQLSESSERKIFTGNAPSLPADVLGTDITYAALGHLHRAQTVNGQVGVRYSGSPIPLSMNERGYRHQVCLVQLDGRRLVSVEPLGVPRSVDFHRIPARAQQGASLDEVLRGIGALPEVGGLDFEHWPFLEVVVQLDKPMPDLRARVDEALAGKQYRLARLGVSYPGSQSALADELSSQNLDEIAPEEVFRRCWQSRYTLDPGPDVLERYRVLVREAEEVKP